MSPTQRQLDALRFIRGYQLAKGRLPAYSEVAAGLGLAKSGKGTVCHFIDSLEERGHLRRLPCREHSLEVLTDIPVPRDPDGTPLYFVRVQ